MRTALIAMSGAIVLTGMVVPAAAQTAADKADARCLLVISVAAQDPKNKESAGRGTFYFLGRLAARGVSSRLGPILVAEAKTITAAAQVQAELQRCGAELNARNNELRTALTQVQKAAAAARPPAKK